MDVSKNIGKMVSYTEVFSDELIIFSIISCVSTVFFIKVFAQKLDNESL